MGGITEILATGRFPGVIVRSPFTEQRQLENQSAKDILKTCKVLEERDGTEFMRTSGMHPSIVKHVWNSEITDQRKNSITERYDDRMARIEEVAHTILPE